MSWNQPADTIVGSTVKEQFGTKPDWLNVSHFSEEYNEFFYIDQDGNIRTNKTLDFESDPQHFELQVDFSAGSWNPDYPDTIFQPMHYTVKFLYLRNGPRTRVSYPGKPRVIPLSALPSKTSLAPNPTGWMSLSFRRSTMSSFTSIKTVTF